MNKTDPKPRLRTSLRVRLLLGYGALVLVLGVFGGISLQQFQQIRLANERILEQTERAVAAEQLSRASLELVRVVQEAVLAEDATLFSRNVTAALDDVDVRYQLLREMLEERAGLDFAIANLRGTVRPWFIQAEAGSFVTLRSSIAILNHNLERVMDALDGIVLTTRQEQRRALADAQAAQQTVNQVIIAGFLIAFLLSGAIGYTTLRSISRSVARLSEGAARLASGDLTYQVTPESRDELGQLALSFNRMGEQLQSFYNSLEARIAERTAELEIINAQMRLSAEVGQAVSSILDIDRLTAQVVQLIHERFALYHVGMFEVDARGAWAIYRAGAGEGAQELLQQDFRLPVDDNSLVGQTIKSGELKLLEDISGVHGRIDIHQVPHTRSEAALPLAARGHVLGALSVQSDQVGGIDQDMVLVLKLLADQVAVALSNAQLFERVQESLEAERRAYGEVSRTAWRQTLQEQLVGYRYDERGVVALADLASDDLAQSTDLPELQLPVRVRGHSIGKLEVHKVDPQGKWSDAERALLRSLVEQLGTTLDAARLYQDTQRRAAREQLASEVTTRMRESLDMETVLKIAVREMREALGAARVEVRLGVPDKSEV